MIAPRTFVVSALASILAATFACSAPPASSEKTGTARQDIIKGKNSDDSQDAVVLVIYLNKSTGEVASCTGTMLANNLVLTARHCVADTDEYAACDADGTPLAGGAVRGNHKASDLWIFTGPKRPDYRPDIKPNGVGAQILDDGGKNLCNHDIALIVLKDPIQDAPIMPLRLDADVDKTDIITAVGWGVTDKTDQPDIRQTRSGIKVESIGPDSNAEPPVAANEFQVGESICSGDSGGPAIAQSTGAIVGIVSRGGNGSQQNTSDPSANCINAENLYTKVAPFKDFILQAYDTAGAEPWLEGQPDPRLSKPDVACADDSECRSNHCFSDPNADGSPTTCAAECSADTDCPDGQECATVQDTKVCRTKAAPKAKSGCAAAPEGPNSGLFAFALCALGLVAVRRRRR